MSLALRTENPIDLTPKSEASSVSTSATRHEDVIIPVIAEAAIGSKDEALKTPESVEGLLGRVSSLEKETLELKKASKKGKKDKEGVDVYRPMWQRASGLIGTALVSGVGIDYALPKFSHSLNPSSYALIALVFLATFEKTAKNFLKSFDHKTTQIQIMTALFASAVLVDFAFSKANDTSMTDLKTYGFSSLVTLVCLKHFALSIASIQKPLKIKS